MTMVLEKSTSIRLKACGQQSETFCAPFRGVHKKFLAGYIAICEFVINLKAEKRRLMKKYPNLKNEIKESFELISKIKEKFESNDYVCRGESNCEWEVISTYNRDKEKTGEKDEYNFRVRIESKQFGITETPPIKRTMNTQAFVQASKRVDTICIDEGGTVSFSIEAQRHYGIPTEEIDFSLNYLCPIFFASKDNHESDGKIIFLRRSSHKYEFIESIENLNVSRSKVQESIFVKSRSGVISPSDYDTIIISKHLKRSITIVLDEFYGINTSTVFPIDEKYKGIEPTDADIHYNETVTLRWMGEKEKSIKVAQRAYELDPKKYGMMVVSDRNGKVKDRIIMKNEEARKLHNKLMKQCLQSKGGTKPPPI